MKPIKIEKCLVPACACGVATRGLCRSHYSYASLLVRGGKTSWPELVKNGRATEKKIHHKSTSWLLAFKKEGK